MLNLLIVVAIWENSWAYFS